MDNSNLGDYENMRRPQNGRMSAASQLHRNPVSRPSTDELAPYSAANYTDHGTKTKYRHGGRMPIVIAVAVAVVLLLIIPGVALAINGHECHERCKDAHEPGDGPCEPDSIW